jgi:NhaP-type Na+/H+ or K+/H+ antiporter
MAGASVDDVFVIVLFGVFTTLATGGNVSASSVAQIPFSIINGLALGVATGWGLTVFFKKNRMRDSIKVLIMMSIAFLFLAVEQWLKDTVTVSGLLAVMAMGATILTCTPVLANRISPKFSKLWVAAEIVLFVLVGATVDLTFAMAAGLAAVAVIFFAIMFRMAGVYLSMLKTRLSMKERLFCMIAYIPKATVQAAIGSLPLAMGLPCGEIVLTVAVLAILITAPLGAFGIDMTYKMLLMHDHLKELDEPIPPDSLGEFGREKRDE